MKKSNITQVVILSGGRGERLISLTKNINKGMVKVARKPFLEHLIELFKANGLKRFLILTGHAEESITEYLGSGKKFGVEISYQHAPSALNHGARFARAIPLLDDFFVLHKNDIYWPFNLEKHLARFNELNVPSMMTVYRNKNKDGIYGPNNNVHINKKGLIERYDNRLSPDPFYHGQDIGFFLLKKQVVTENLPLVVPDNFCLHHQFLSDLAEKGLLGAFETNIPATTTTDVEWLQKAEKYFTSQTSTPRSTQYAYLHKTANEIPIKMVRRTS
ncbi:MAG: D-glycero-D-manno-heptose 1,7-bisphosphate phosphatase [Parcubacteria group bacterium Gr01-1014_17]|nr:MAG: D-glycero-D-manno-heptose 1,7-bisphosphate phosphatase [Parcubacteria group bacterium Gr01-1014_17]